MAAITGIDKELYEAARVDGAGRFRQMWNITLPGIRTTISVLLIMSIGHLVGTGFEKQMQLSNSLLTDYSEVLDLYALKYGINIGRFSYGTAISMFTSVVGITLLLVSNGILKKTTKESIM
ncbi:putative multiple-sugar transport system permease YteP [compost metagenome]